MSAMLVTQAQSELARRGRTRGTVYASTMTTAHGTAVQSTHGRNLPQRVFVRSASTPIIGSKNASQSRPTSSIVPASRGGDAHRVGVEVQLEQNHRHEDEVRRGVAEAVSSLLDERESFRGT